MKQKLQKSAILVASIAILLALVLALGVVTTTVAGANVGGIVAEAGSGSTDLPSAGGDLDGSYTLTKTNTNFNNGLEVAKGKVVTIDLNGQVIDLNGYWFEVASGGTLSFVDNATSKPTYYFTPNEYGVWELTGRKVGSDYSSYELGVWTDATADVVTEYSVEGGVITGGNLSIGGAIQNEGTLTTNVHIVGNWASSGGGAIYNLNTYTMAGGSIQGNMAPTGGAIYNTTIFNLEAGLIANNVALDSDGGAIFGNNTSEITITGGTITGNCSKVANAGGIYSTGKLKFYGGVIEDNEADENGQDVCQEGETTIGKDAVIGDLYLALSGTIVIGTEGNALITGEGGASVGISMQSPDIFLSQTVKIDKATAACFHAYDDDYCVSFCEEDKSLKLQICNLPKEGGEISGEYKLSRTNAGFEAYMYVVANATVTIDLNGNVVDLSCYNIYVESNATLIIKDTAESKPTYYFTPDANGLWVLTGRKVGEVYSSYAAGVWADATADVVTEYSVEGGVITGGQGYMESEENYGGAIVSFGSLTLTNVNFVGNGGKNIPELYGGAVHQNGGECSITNCSFKGNQGTYGGAVSVYECSYFETKGATIFEANYATSLGGAIRVTTADDMTIEGASFIGNSASEYGGAIYVYDNSKITIANTAFTGNSAQYYSVIYTYADGCDVELDTVTIENNGLKDTSDTSELCGLILVDGKMAIKNSTIQDNITSSKLIENFGELTLDNTTVSNNIETTNDYFGAIYSQYLEEIYPGVLIINNSTITGHITNDEEWSYDVADDEGTVILGGENHIGYLYFWKPNKIQFATDPALAFDTKSSIGISMETPGVFYTQTNTIDKAVADCFHTLDEDEYYISLWDAENKNQLMFHPYNLPEAGGDLVAGTYKLNRDNTGFTNRMNVKAGTTVTIDLNGYIVDLNSKVIAVEDNTSILNVIDSTLGTADAPTYYFDISEESGKEGLWINPSKTKTATNEKQSITGGAIVNGGGTNGGAIANVGNTTINANFVGNYASTNGGVINNKGSLTIEGGSILGNVAQITGGAINNNGVAEIKGGTIAHNVATRGNGGAIFSGSGKTITITAGTITQNECNGEGGGIYSRGTLEIYGGSITGNTADNKGQDIYYGNGTVTIGKNAVIGELYIASGMTIALGSEDNALTTGEGGASIGIGMETPGVFYTQADEISKAVADCFHTLDEDEYYISLWDAENKNQLMFHPYNLPEAGGDLADGTYKLNRDNTGFTAAMTVKVGTTVTIDLNGHVVDLNGKNIYVEAGATLNIIDSAESKPTYYFTPNADGKWVLTGRKAGEVYSSYADGAWTDATADVVTEYSVEGGVITNGGGYFDEEMYWGGAIDNFGALTTSVHFVGNSVENGGGAIYNEDYATYTMEGGSIQGNTAGCAGAITNRGTFTFEDGLIAYNVALDDAGAIFNTSVGTMTMTGGTITGNYAKDSASGGIRNKGNLYLYGGSITGNTTDKIGIDVHHLQGTVTLGKNVTIGELYIASGLTIALGTGGNALTTGEGAASVGITMETPGVFYTQIDEISEAVAACFHPYDAAEYNACRVNANKSLMLHANNLPVAGGDLVDGTYKLSKDNVGFTASMTVKAGTTVTVDLNGYIVDLSGKYFYVEKGATLNVIDSKLDAADAPSYYFNKSTESGKEGLWKLSGKVEGSRKYSYDSAQGNWLAELSMDVTTQNYVKGGAIINGGGNNGGAISNSGNLTINANFVGNYASAGGGAINSEGTYTLEGGSILGNVSGKGGAIYNNGGKFYMNGGKIAYNVGNKKNAGAVYNGQSATMEMTAGEITQNYAKQENEDSIYGYGGGIYNVNTVKLFGGSITGNKADFYGQDVFHEKGSIAVGGTVVVGEIYIASGKIIEIGKDANALAEGASVGISMEASGVFYTQSKAISEEVFGCFKAYDEEGDSVCLYDNDKKLMLHAYNLPQEGGDLAEGTYKLTRDNTGFTANMNVKEGTTVTIDLNGYIVDLNGKSFNVEVGATLNIIDSAEDKPTYYFDKSEESGKEGLWINPSKDETDTNKKQSITGGAIVNGDGAISNSGNLTINANFVGNYASAYGGAIANKGSLTIEGGSIQGNVAYKIIFNISTCYIKGGTIAYNVTGIGVILNTEESKVEMTAGTITQNSDGKAGINNGGNLAIYGGSITGNTADNDCHDVYVGGGSITIGGSAVIGELYLGWDMKIALGSEGNALTTGEGAASVGISMAKLGVFYSQDDAIDEDLFNCFYPYDAKEYYITLWNEDKALQFHPYNLPKEGGDLVAGTYKLTRDNTGFTAGMIVKADTTVTIDLNGYIVDLSGKYFYVEKGATLNIIDSAEDKPTYYFTPDANDLWVLTGRKVGAEYSAYADGEWTEATATVVTKYNVEGGVITNGNGMDLEEYGFYGGAIANFGTLTTKVNFVGNSVDGNGGVIDNCGVYTLESGSIIGNVAGCGGAIVNYFTFNMKGGKIAYNTATKYGGGAVYNSEGCTMTMTGGEITKNTARYLYDDGDEYGDGGGIRNIGTLNLYGGSITDNAAGLSGKDVCQSNGTLTVGGAAEIGELYLASGKIIALGSEGNALTTGEGGASVGISMAKLGVFYSQDDAIDEDLFNCFYPYDADEYYITLWNEDKALQFHPYNLPKDGGELVEGLYKLNRDNVGLTATMAVPGDAVVTIDLNGYIVDLNLKNIKVAAKGTLNVIDSTLGTADAPTYYFDISDATGRVGRWINPSKDKTDTNKKQSITGGAIINGGAAVAGAILNYGNVTINANFVGNFTPGSMGIINNNGNLTIEGGSMLGNIAGIAGGAIYNNGVAEIKGGTIAHNVANRGNGGAIVNYMDKTLTITGGTITQNTCGNAGGGICNAGTLYIYGGSITGNTAKEAGQDIYMVGISITIGGSAVIGGIHLDKGMTVTLGTGEYALVAGASIGISSVGASETVLASGVTEAIRAYFHEYDADKQTLYLNEDVLTIHDNNLTVASNLVDGIYKLSKDNTGFKMAMTVPEDAVVTIDLNGHVVDLNGKNICVNKGATLNIIDSAEDKPTYYFTPNANGLWVLTGRKVGAAYSSYAAGVWTSATSAVVTKYKVEGGVITNGGGCEDLGYYWGGAIESNGTLTINANFVGNQADLCGAIDIKNGITTMEGGSILGNVAMMEAGAISNLDATFIMNGGKIAYNIAKEESAGGVLNGGTMEIYGGSITDNEACFDGQDVYENGSKLTIGKNAVIGDLCLGMEKTITLATGENVLVAGASIGLSSCYDLETVVNGGVTETIRAYFHEYDAEEATLFLDDGVLTIHHNNLPTAGGDLATGLYKLTRDNVGFTDIMTVKDGITVTIDLNGHVIDLNDKGISVNKGGTLNIIDTAESKPTYYFTPNENGLWVLTGRKVGSKYSSYAEGVWTSATSAVVTKYKVEGGVITGGNEGYYYNGTYFGGALFNNGTLVMSDVNIVGNGRIDKEIWGGTIYQNKSKLEITGGSFKGNIGVEGSVIFSNDSEVNVTGTLFEANYASYEGGAIMLVENNVLTLKDATFTGNKATDSAAIYLYGSSDIANIDNINVTNNGLNDVDDTAYLMCAISNNGTMTIENSTIKDNILTGYIIYNIGTMTINNCTITDNIETIGTRGAVYNKRQSSSYPGILYIYDSTITDHTTNDANKHYDVVNVNSSITLGGDVKIDELYLPTGQIATAAESPNALKSGASIGILLQDGKGDAVLGNVSLASEEYFFSVDKSKAVLYENHKMIVTDKPLDGEGGELSGTYALRNDVTMENDIIVPEGEELTIDLNNYILNLNGHKILVYGKFNLVNWNEKTVTYFFDKDATGLWTNVTKTKVADNAAQSVNGGVITGGTYATIIVYKGGSFEMKGGNIVGNRNLSGGGAVNSKGDVTILSGTITGNTAPVGAGVYHNGTGLTIGGSAYIYGNTDDNGNSSNIFVNKGAATIKASETVPFEEGAFFGLAPATPNTIVVIGVQKADQAKFTSDVANRALRVASGNLKSVTAQNITNTTVEGDKDTNNGYSTVDEKIRLEGETVTITAFANEGYTVGDVLVYRAGSNDLIDVIKVGGTAYAFEVPDCDVTVKVTFKKLIPANGGELSGEYKLEDNLTLTSDIVINEGDVVVIDLFGKTLDLNGHQITNNGTLIIKDSTIVGHNGFGGTITGGKKNAIDIIGTATIQDINITGNSGPAVNVCGKATINNVNITGNTSTGAGVGLNVKEGGEAFVSNAVITGNESPMPGKDVAFAGKLTLSEKVVIGDLFVGSKMLTVDGEKPISVGSDIGVTTAETKDFVVADIYSIYDKYFRSNLEDQVVYKDGLNLALGYKINIITNINNKQNGSFIASATEGAKKYAIVTISADLAEGFTVHELHVIQKANGQEVKTSTTDGVNYTFKMPAEVEITATFRKNYDGMNITSILVDYKDDATIALRKLVITGETVEYAISLTDAEPEDGEAWTTDYIFTELNADTYYYIFARIAQNDVHYKGATVSAEIKTKKAPGEAPQGITAPSEFQQKASESSLTFNGKAGLEYILSKSTDAPELDDWSKDSTYRRLDKDAELVFINLDANCQYYLHYRMYETDDAMPSNSAYTDGYTRPVALTITEAKGILILTDVIGGKVVITDSDNYEASTDVTFSDGKKEVKQGDEIVPGGEYYIRYKKVDKRPTSKATMVIAPSRAITPDNVDVATITRTDTTLSLKATNTKNSYSIDGGKTWIKGLGDREALVFDELEAGKIYNIITRVDAVTTEGSEMFASLSSQGAKVATKLAPAAVPDKAVALVEQDISTITVTAAAGIEMVIVKRTKAEDFSWATVLKNAVVTMDTTGTYSFTNLSTATLYMIFFRYAETNTAMASKTGEIRTYTLAYAPIENEGYKLVDLHITVKDGYEVVEKATSGKQSWVNKITGEADLKPDTEYVVRKARKESVPESAGTTFKTMKKATLGDFRITFAENEDFIYDGKDLTITVSTDCIGIGEYIVQYSNDGKTWTGALPKNAGEYAMKLVLKRGTNYVSGEVVCNPIVITKATVEAPTYASKTYNGEKLYADASDTALYTVTENNGGIFARDYDVVLTLVEPDNYTWADTEDAEKAIQFTIDKFDITGAEIFLDETELVYNGALQQKVVSSVWKGDMNIIFFKVSGDMATTAGVHEITVTGTTNFTGSVKTQYTIAKADYDMSGITFEDATYRYDGKEKGIEVAGELPTGFDGYSVTVTYTEGLTDVGTKTIVATFATASINYNVPEAMTATLTIQAAKMESLASDDSEEPDVIVETANGFPEDLTLEVVVKTDANAIQRVNETNGWSRDLFSAIEANEVIYGVCGIKLFLSGEEIQPDEIAEGTELVVKIRIPEKLKGKEFQIIATKADGSVERLTLGNKMANGRFVIEGSYVVTNVEEVVEFAFVAEGAPEVADIYHWIAIAAAAAYFLFFVVYLIKKRRGVGVEFVIVSIAYITLFVVPCIIGIVDGCAYCVSAIIGCAGLLAFATLAAIIKYGVAKSKEKKPLREPLKKAPTKKTQSIIPLTRNGSEQPK